MTTYGTIPTSQPPPSTPTPNLEFITRATHKIRSTYTTHRRPWLLFLSSSSLSLPSSLSSAFLRLKTNLSFFRVNYAIISLSLLFLSLLFHPVSLIVFLLTLAAWLFLYFLRDEPLVVIGYSVDDRIVLGFLAVLTVVFLLLTDVTVNIVVALGIAAVVIAVHAVVRSTDDIPDSEAGFEVDGAAPGGYSRGVGRSGERLPLKDAASSSFSASN